MPMDAGDMVVAWLLATLLFLVLVGSGRTLRGRMLGRPPFGAGIALSAALGVFLFSMIWMGLGHFGGLRSPFPEIVLAFGVLLALPGLYWTFLDYGDPGPGLERGFGPRWFAGGAWFLLIASLVISFFWISGVYSYGGVGFLFERAGFDYAVGRSFFDPGMPRDPFLGDEPLSLWAFGLGSPEAALALAWWLGVAILFGVCGIGWRLQHHGAGLAAAAVLAVVLFASDNPLFLAPALPAALVLTAVMILAVESRGHPHLGRTLVAGGLGGFALISDFGSLAMLAALLVFGPFWCKKAKLLAAEGLDDGDGRPGNLAPLRHSFYGLLGLSIVMTPWLARNYDWVGDPCYGFDDDFYVGSDYRFFDVDRDEPGFQSGFGQPGDRIEEYQGFELRGQSYRFGKQDLIWGKSDVLPNPRTQIDPIFLDYEVEFGPNFLDRCNFCGEYLEATEWGYGLLLAGAFAPIVGGRRRRERAMYFLPAFAGFSAGAYAGDFETTTPSALALVSVTAGQALWDMKDCRSPIRNTAMGGVVLTGGLSLGLTGANDCDFWPTWGDYYYFPQLEFHDPPPEEDEDQWEFKLGYRWGDWKLDADPRQGEEEPEDDWGWDPKVKYNYDFGQRFELRAEYQWRDEDSPGTVPTVPGPGFQITPEYTLPPEGEGKKVPRTGPSIPGYKPDVRPEFQINPKYQYKQPSAPKQPTTPKQPPTPRTTPGRY